MPVSAGKAVFKCDECGWKKSHFFRSDVIFCPHLCPRCGVAGCVNISFCKPSGLGELLRKKLDF